MKAALPLGKAEAGGRVFTSYLVYLSSSAVIRDRIQAVSGGGASDSGVNGTDYRSRNVRGYFGSILAPLRDGRMAGDTRSDVFDRRC
jgi:hypothetical protein